jgi:hypothetical protein
MHTQGGWVAQWDRLGRWHARASARLTGGLVDETIDDLIVFFQTAYALGDWLVAHRAIERKQVQRIFDTNETLGVCRTIANSTKHRFLDPEEVFATIDPLTSSRDLYLEDVTLSREYDWGLETTHLNIWVHASKFHAAELVDAVMKAWTSELGSRRLLPIPDRAQTV